MPQISPTAVMDKPETHSLNMKFIRHVSAIGIIAVTIMMSIMAGMFYYQGKKVEEAKKWLVHTYDVINHIQVLSNKFKDAELGQRGYILTGDDRYLAPYNDAILENDEEDFAIDPMVQHHSIRQEIEFLKLLTKDNANQQKSLSDLTQVAKDILEYWNSTISLRRSENESIIDATKGKKLMDRIRKIRGDMLSEENRLLMLRSNFDELSQKYGNALTFISLSFFYISMLVSVGLITRHWKRARKAEAEVYTRAQEIAEANRELQATNEKLSDFTQELQRNEEELKTQQEELESSNEEMEEKNKILEEQNAQIRLQSQELAEHKRLIEEKIKEVELSSKYKSEFLANMSHELRTPLNSLLILARSLANNEEGNLSEEQIQEARVIHSGGLELLGLINDILDLSKVEAGKLSIVADDVGPDVIAKRLEQQFEPLARDSGVKFIIRIAEDLPSSIYTDSQRVEQILKNLLANAFKFTEKGSITLAVHRFAEDKGLQRKSLGVENAIAFSVIDTGIGIEENKLKDIFEAFQQEDGSTDRHYGGTGLGLTIARKFAHMLGGEIHVASRKGEGSTFTLALPLKLQESENQNQTQTQTQTYKDNAIFPAQAKETLKSATHEFISDDRKNINPHDKVLLIIEDDRNFSGTLMKIAHKRGYKCLAAGDGKDGMLLAAEQNVSAIILDLKLPDIDGMNVLEHLKHNLKTRHIPVHIISGQDQADSVLPMRKGAMGYLTKPVDFEDINGAFLKIEKLLDAQIKKILVIEDDKNTQSAIQSLLKKKDIEIIVAESGRTALMEANKQHFDCIILDLNLPDMTGFQWLKQAEEQAGDHNQPPVIIYTAQDLTEDENRALNHYTGSIVIKGETSAARLLDEVTLFLHSVESTLTKDQQAMIRMRHDPDTALQGRTILLADDDMRNTFALSKTLKKRGLNVIIADNGEMALEKLKEIKNIELVIMDIMMPVMDGYEAIRQIRILEEHRDLPVIALTARAMLEEQERCMNAGANDYMTKPVDIDRLLTLMRVWLFRQEKAA